MVKARKDIGETPEKHPNSKERHRKRVGKVCAGRGKAYKSVGKARKSTWKTQEKHWNGLGKVLEKHRRGGFGQGPP